MAAVRIEEEAFSDERYEDLAIAAGLQDSDHARGKMARLWRQCTLEHTHNLLVSTVVRVLGTNGVEALRSARLGELTDDGRVRIRGTEGRIEWLSKLRENGRKGGRPKTQIAKATHKPNGFEIAKPSGSDESNPSALASATANIRDTASRLSTCPESFELDLTSEANRRAVAKAQARGVDVSAELEGMRDWSLGAGSKGKKADWQATARNFLRSARVNRANPQWQKAQTEIRQIKRLTDLETAHE